MGKKNKKPKFVIESEDRRQFLRTAAGMAVTMPFLSSISNLARAQSAANFPKRLVVFHTGNGWPGRRWRPGLNLWNPGSHGNRVRNLSDGGRSISLNDLVSIQGNISNIFSESGIMAHRDKMLLVEGLDMSPPERSHHYDRETLSCVGYKSLDWVLNDLRRLNPSRKIPIHLTATPRVDGDLQADRISVQAKDADYKYYSYTRRNGSTGYRLTTRPETAWYDDSYYYYRNLFRNLDTNQPPSAPSGMSLESKRLSAASVALEQYNLLKNSPKISAEDKRKLEQHFDYLADYERRLESQVSTTPTQPTNSCTGVGEPRINTSDHVGMMNQHIEMMAAAIKCNVSQNMILQTIVDNSRGGDYIYRFLGITKKLHVQISHSPSNSEIEDHAKIGRWQAAQIAKFLEALDVEEENGRTYLDNTLVLWTNSLGAATDSSNSHSYHNKPVAMWGGTGYFDTGRFVSYANTRNKDGIPQGHFFTEILKGFGLAPSEYERHGRGGFGFELSPISTQRRNDAGKTYDLSDSARRRGLPGLRKA